MVWVVLGMTMAVVLAAFVVGVVAIPARRSGRFVLTPRGERAFRMADERARAARSKVKRREGSAKLGETARDSTQEPQVAEAVSNKVASNGMSEASATSTEAQSKKKRKVRKK